MRRRQILGGFSLAAVTPLGFVLAQAVPQPAEREPQAPKLDDTVGTGFNRIVIARWGDAVFPDAPPFTPYPLTALQADRQFPYDAAIAGFVIPPPAQDGIPRLIATFANPAAPARMVFPSGMDVPDVAGRLQGVTVLNLQFMRGRWVTVDGGYQSRRLNDDTLCQISGPAASAIGNTVQGILAPQGGCVTPWGTVLLVEDDPSPWLTRLAGALPRFADPLIAPSFAWVTELDPLDPLSIPVKRTALGRFPRAGIAVGQAADGRAVVFMSQDSPSGFLFRFITAAAAADGSALDAGVLAVAKIEESAVIWVDLGTDMPSIIGALSAASSAGASSFDSPGGIAIAMDGTNSLYLACAGNSERGEADINALNPRAGDDNGHILVFTPPGGDLTQRSFAGSLAILAGNPRAGAHTQYGPGSDCWFRKPRTLNLDTLGQLWIGTDQGGERTATADGLFIMQTGGSSQYQVNFAYLAPVGAAIGGAAFDPASRTIFAVVRHPGATPQASFDHPATRWPTLLPNMPPQTTVIGLISQI
jgi:secreted PhoX family phosphatase